MTGTALVVGASGIVGSAIADLLLAEGWTGHGLSRRPREKPGIRQLGADLQDRAATAAALADVRPDADVHHDLAGNEAFNVVNGDVFRFGNEWLHRSKDGQPILSYLLGTVR